MRTNVLGRGRVAQAARFIWREKNAVLAPGLPRPKIHGLISTSETSVFFQFTILCISLYNMIGLIGFNQGFLSLWYCYLFQVAVLLVGTNNYNNTTDQIVEGIEAILWTMHEKMPSTSILVLVGKKISKKILN